MNTETGTKQTGVEAPLPRTSAVAFLMPLNLDMEAIMEIKTMLAEAIVNAMIHG